MESAITKDQKMVLKVDMWFAFTVSISNLNILRTIKFRCSGDYIWVFPKVSIKNFLEVFQMLSLYIFYILNVLLFFEDDLFCKN